ncbi:MAG: 3-methyl-2-oxobutanoate hydroxymethyltransferase [Pelotomaculum sp. PtaB.Bin104]|nr:MAG: 3-methyl-2-oxobutanoate hydroxymethyltransferase [Pelotomaculum sp. PtaB.Bin104]
MELVPTPLAKLITESSSVPIVGIGAGPYCDGQVLVLHDILGLYPRFTPRFVKQYANLHEQMALALKKYTFNNEYPLKEITKFKIYTSSWFASTGYQSTSVQQVYKKLKDVP